MTETILIVNPNSSSAVTQGIRDALSEHLPQQAHLFEVTDIPASPATIMTDADVDAAGIAFCQLLSGDGDRAGYITACFSDPGLQQARNQVGVPVTGIQEAAFLTAARVADRFGIIALSKKSIPRHLKCVEAMGLTDKLVDELPLPDVSAEASGRDPEVYKEVVRLAEDLRDRGAGAIVLGCAGMAVIRNRLAETIGIPVVDPILAGAELALQRLSDAEHG